VQGRFPRRAPARTIADDDPQVSRPLSRRVDFDKLSRATRRIQWTNTSSVVPAPSNTALLPHSGKPHGRALRLKDPPPRGWSRAQRRSGIVRRLVAPDSASRSASAEGTKTSGEVLDRHQATSRIEAIFATKRVERSSRCCDWFAPMPHAMVRLLRTAGCEGAMTSRRRREAA